MNKFVLFVACRRNGEPVILPQPPLTRLTISISRESTDVVGSKPCFRFTQTLALRGKKTAHEVRMSKTKHKIKGRGGRPSIPSDQVRRHTIGVRVNEDERHRIQEKADLMNMAPAQWLRHAALDRILPPCPAPKLNRDVYVELGRIGNNINQLVKVANSGRTPAILPPFRELVNAIIKIRLEILGVHHDSEAD